MARKVQDFASTAKLRMRESKRETQKVPTQRLKDASSRGSPEPILSSKMEIAFASFTN